MSSPSNGHNASAVNAFIKSLTLLILPLMFGAEVVQAHFSLAPRIEILPLEAAKPETRLIGNGGSSASRRDYLDTLQRLTAFDTKYQKVQTSFSTHFDLIRGVAFFHPENVHEYIDNLKLIESNPRLHDMAVKAWFGYQAEMFARLLPFRQSARQQGLAERPAIRPVLDLYAAGAKTALLEELIILGEMPPTLEGISRFAKEKSGNYRILLEKGVRLDTEVTPPEEQRRLKKRWSDFRREVLQQTKPTRYEDRVTRESKPDTLIAEVNDHRITWGDYVAIYGEPSSGKRWYGLNKANLSRIILFYAMADLADRLELVPQRVLADIRLSSEIYLTAVQLVRQAAPKLLDKGGDKLTLKDVSGIMQYPRVIEVKDWLLADKRDDAVGNMTLDKGFINGTDWSLKRVLAPKHSIHL